MDLVRSRLPIFTAIPDPENARVLRTELNTRIAHDLRTFTGIARRAVPREATAALSAIDQLPLDDRLSPLVFFWHQDLQAALKAQHIDGARAALRQLAALCVDARAGAPIQLRTVDDGPIREALHRIAASHTVTGDSPDVATVVDPVDPAYFEQFRGDLDAALELIGAADPEMLAEIREYASEVRLYQGQGPRGVTSILAFGAVFMRRPHDPAEPTVAYALETLAHEASHLVLYALMALDPLVTNAFEGTFASPLRRDPRPLYGIVHQTFVLARLHRLWDRLARIGEGWAEQKLEEDHRSFLDGYRAIREHAKLTPAGEVVVDSLTRCAR